MSSRRIARLLELREKALDVARLALEAAIARTAEAEIAVAQARAEAARAEDAVASLELVSAGDLIVAAAHVDSCQRRVGFARERLRAVAAGEARAREAVNEARIKVRQIELWRENAAARAASAAEIEERKLHDALAARTVRGDAR